MLNETLQIGTWTLEELRGRLTLKGLSAFASPSVLHHFACDCAERALRQIHAVGGVTELRCWQALQSKRQWIEGKLSLDELKSALRMSLNATMDALENQPVDVAWGHLAVVEALYWEPEEAALRAGAKVARASSRRVLRWLRDSAQLPEPTGAHVSAQMNAVDDTHGREALSLSSGLGAQGEAQDTRAFPLWMQAWISERVWQEDHLWMLIQGACESQRQLLQVLLLRQYSLSGAAERWGDRWEEALFLG